VSVGMSLVISTGFRFERIANVYAGTGWGQIDPKVVARGGARKEL
jgi:hypothetical protein